MYATMWSWNQSYLQLFGWMLHRQLPHLEPLWSTTRLVPLSPSKISRLAFWTRINEIFLFNSLDRQSMTHLGEGRLSPFLPWLMLPSPPRKKKRIYLTGIIRKYCTTMMRKITHQRPLKGWKQELQKSWCSLQMQGPPSPDCLININIYT